MANNFYGAILLSGGATGALDAIDGAGLADLDAAIVQTDGVVYFYSLDATSGAAESSPGIISPDTNAGTKRWILQGVKGIGAWELIETIEASNDATIDFTGFDSSYDQFMGILSSIIPITDTASLSVRVSTSGSWKSGASDYSWGRSFSGASGSGGTGDEADTDIEVAANSGTGSGEEVNAVLIIQSLTVATRKTAVYLDAIIENASGNFVSIKTGGRYNTAEANDGLRFFMSSGNIASGEFKLYGLRK